MEVAAIDSFRRYQQKLFRDYDLRADEFGFRVLDGLRQTRQGALGLDATRSTSDVPAFA